MVIIKNIDINCRHGKGKESRESLREVVVEEKWDGVKTTICKYVD
jgi:hypothetical protein